VVDDDAGIRGMLAEYLSGHGYVVDTAAGGVAMRAALGHAVPHVVLLDLNLPGEDGLALARWLRDHHTVGIIMITGAGDVIDRVVGLEMGADDYLTKPFDLRELRARIKSLMRRLPAPDSTSAEPDFPDAGPSDTTVLPATAATHRVAVGNTSLDLASHRLFNQSGEEIPLTSMEFELLRVFVERPNQVLSRDQLLNHTRNREWEPFDRSIDIRITRLRRKIEVDPAHPRLLRTVRGTGYMFVPDT
jgi:two-component system phosphate regulon response regulator OmpR